MLNCEGEGKGGGNLHVVDIAAGREGKKKLTTSVHGGRDGI